MMSRTGGQTQEVPAVSVKVDEEAVNELKERNEELKAKNDTLAKEVKEAKEEASKKATQLQAQVKDLNQELRTRVSVKEMAKIKRILVTLQQVGIAVDFNETTELPIPKTEAILLEKIRHLETATASCARRSTTSTTSTWRARTSDMRWRSSWATRAMRWKRWRVRSRSWSSA